MTRKDYILIAAAIADARAEIECSQTGYPDDLLEGVRYTSEFLAHALAQDNERFDRVWFLKACEVQS